MWNTGANSNSGGSKEAFIREGNLDFLTIAEEKHRITPLTQAVDVDLVMSGNQMTREQAMEHIYTVMAESMWINPKAYWEHSVPSIPNTRFYSTIPCQGRQTCKCCADNGIAETQGITENKMKPFPVRKKFIIPVWSYKLNRVLFIRKNEKFVGAMGEYINQFGDAIDFDVWRTGKGFSTEYHSMYIGARTGQVPTNVEIILPNQIDLTIPEEEINKRIGNKSAGARGTAIQQQPAQPTPQYGQNINQQSQPAQPAQPFQNYQQPPAGQPAPGQNQVTHIHDDTPIPGTVIEPSVGMYMFPFGNYKGQSLESVYLAGDLDYLKFLANQGAGLVKEKVTAFLMEKGES